VSTEAADAHTRNTANESSSANDNAGTDDTASDSSAVCLAPLCIELIQCRAPFLQDLQVHQSDESLSELPLLQ
jgi:hypothetical protein